MQCVNGLPQVRGEVTAESREVLHRAQGDELAGQVVDGGAFEGEAHRGLVVRGPGTKTVLIRAVGPTLGTFGVTNALADPKLELYRGTELLQANDNWNGTDFLANAFTQVGAFALPATSKDSALLVTLQPGAYTAQISGVGGSTGVALVGVYEGP